MSITQTVEIPVSHQLTLNVPHEVPAGPVILTFTPAGGSEKQRKLAAFRQLSREVAELSLTDPLPPLFDELLKSPFKLRELSVQ